MRNLLKGIGVANAVAFSGIQSLTIALYPFLAEKLNLPLSTLIGCSSLGSFLFVLGSPFWARRSDEAGRRRVLTVGSFALFLSFATLVVLVRNPIGATTLGLAILAASRVVYGLIASAMAPVAQSLQADIAGEKNATKGMLLHSMSLSLGRVLGLCSVIFFSSQMLWLLLGWAVVVASVAAVNLVVPAQEPLREMKTVAPATSWREEFVQVKWLLATALLFTCFVEALNSSLGGTLRVNFQLESLAASALTARVLLAASVGVLLVQASGKIFRDLSLRAGLLSGVTALAVGSIIFATSASYPQLWVAVVILIFGIGILPPFYMAALRAGCPPTHYGRRAGLMASSHTLGYAIGGGIAALAFRFASIPVGYVLSVIAIFIAVACTQHARVRTTQHLQEAA